MESIIIIAILTIGFIAYLSFLKKVKLHKHQEEFIQGISRELNIPKEEVLWLFIEFGQILMLYTQSQGEGNQQIAKDVDARGHLEEYKHWKDVAKIVHESVAAYQKNHPDK